MTEHGFTGVAGRDVLSFPLNLFFTIQPAYTVAYFRYHQLTLVAAPPRIAIHDGPGPILMAEHHSLRLTQDVASH